MTYGVETWYFKITVSKAVVEALDDDDDDDDNWLFDLKELKEIGNWKLNFSCNQKVERANLGLKLASCKFEEALTTHPRQV